MHRRIIQYIEGVSSVVINEEHVWHVVTHPIRPFQPEAVAQYMKYMQVVKKNAKNRHTFRAATTIGALDQVLEG